MAPKTTMVSPIMITLSKVRTCMEPPEEPPYRPYAPPSAPQDQFNPLESWERPPEEPSSSSAPLQNLPEYSPSSLCARYVPQHGQGMIPSARDMSEDAYEDFRQLVVRLHRGQIQDRSERQRARERS